VTDERPVALVGFMGSGKSAVGRAVADALGWTFADSDAEIETRLGRPIARIFDESVEAAFGEVERRVAFELIDRPRGVVALGGGAFCSAVTRARLGVAARTVWLDAPLESCRARVGTGSGRPLWVDGDAPALRALYERRRAVYALACHRVDASGAVEAILRDVLSILQDSR
jgi:shikimate kinase